MLNINFSEYECKIDMSQGLNRSSKTIISILVLAIAILSYVVFVNPSHDPITLSEEAESSLLDDDANAALWEQNREGLQGTQENVDLEGLEQTPLDLTLLGLVASDTQSEASATIQSRLQVRTYYVNDQIAYTKATLVEIRNDRVILLNNGSKEVLLLQGTKSSDHNYAIDPKDSDGENYTIVDDPEGLAKKIGNRPKLLEHVISTQPHTANDGTLGMLVSPGQNPKLYKAARFKEGDVLQKVNGHDVTTDEGLEAIQTLIPNAQTLVFSVLRGGRVISLYLDIPSEGLKVKTN
ncbi:DUF2138 family protein [Aliiglaciecola litoralis]|uniref:Type II secretion system protein GspC N-terminal domain-containing protein n=1 Tax=Aliiglaciecola litoralis TaxID=582857 RepID=A0ABN1LHE8_9ALTE